MPLTKDGIYDMALRLIDADGVEALTMRKLATALNANPMSLYHHVPNKDAVLQGVARTVGAQFRTATREDAAWQDRIRQLAEDFRTLAHRHPELMTYSFARPDFIQPEDPFWLGLTAVLEDAGVPEAETPQVAAPVCAAVLGVLIAEVNGALHQWSALLPTGDGDGGRADTGPDDSRMFHLALEMIIAGLNSRLTSERVGRDSSESP
ncbi:TetR family transcriptional regulator [Streptomyces sp. NBC_00638]|uniref:TetR/AcrR family transcriptional regulator n=1 Tax=unclassified Streptomyces TaxID=2593676 RepID=UPI0022571F6A|nr:TetR family transcriptional regulator [Streptomyces sp. NBC_00638]MCX5008612.1 TetR family transcriptional regulator [Streptomyces sp. NBC_00638]